MPDGALALTAMIIDPRLAAILAPERWPKLAYGAPATDSARRRAVSHRFRVRIVIEQYWEGFKLLLWNSVWAVNVAALPPARAYAVRTARVCHTLIREFVDGELNQRAASLVFTTLLSLVPLLAVSFSVLKAFGVHNDLEQVLIGFLAPLGDKGIELGDRIMAFVDNVNGRVLGGIGLTLLMLTVLSLVHKVERSFNYIWRVERPRGFIERFSGYLSALLVGPVLIFTALGVTASIMHTSLMQEIIAIEPLGTVIKWLISMIPYLLVITAFTLVYVFVPNTKVQIRAAFVGAVIAGILWESAGWSFASFVANSPRHAAIYSSFAVAFLFMIWLYVAWLILLVGATVAFFIQHPEYHGMPDRVITLSNRMREKLATLAVFRIAQHHVHGGPPVSVSRLSLQLGVPVAALEDVLDELVSRGLLVEVSGQEVAYVPGRDVSSISMNEVWTAIRVASESHWISHDRMRIDAAVEELIGKMDDAVAGVIGSMTLKDLVSDHPPEQRVKQEVATDEGSLETNEPIERSRPSAAEPVPISSAKRDREGRID